VECLRVGKGLTTVGGLSHAVGWFNGQIYRYAETKGYECRRLACDNSVSHKIHEWRSASQAVGNEGVKALALDPKDQRQGRAFGPPADIVSLKPFVEIWTYAVPQTNSTVTNEMVPAKQRIHQGRRSDMALGECTSNSDSQNSRHAQPGEKENLVGKKT
jgi:hypothetical protein